MYDIQSIYMAQSIDGAIKALMEAPNAVIIAGGSDVLIKIREGKMSGSKLIGIRNIKELNGIILAENADIHIGPTTTFSHVTSSPIIQKYIPVLGYAVDQAGGPQLRNIGTIGGNISNGVTSADSASTLFALDAVLEITGPNGTRYLPIANYYKGPGKVNLEQAELLTKIIIPKQSYEGYFGNYIKYAMRNAMDIATLGCSANCKLDDSKTKIVDFRLAFGVAGPVPMRAHETEKVVKGMSISKELFNTVGSTALTEVNPRSSWRASKQFRLQLVRELSVRTLKQSIIYAGGVIND